MSDEPARKRRFRFSVRTLLIVVVLLSLPLGWIGIVAERTRKQKKILESIPHSRPVAEWRFGYVTGLRFSPRDIGFLSGPTCEDLAHLKRFSRLEALCCHGVTDDGLLHIGRLTTLKELTLVGDEITGSGLQYLKAMTNLEELVLWESVVTDEGISELQKALPNCEIHLNRPTTNPRPALTPTNPSTP